MTPIEWLKEKLQSEYGDKYFCKIEWWELDKFCEQAKAKEKKQIIDAITYALDEDGHTGDWKIKFANDYYEALNKGYDIRNKNVQRFFGAETVQTPKEDL